jgi:hypothetical protein
MAVERREWWGWRPKDGYPLVIKDKRGRRKEKCFKDRASLSFLLLYGG